MATLVTRSGKGSPLTHDEVDANFNNLNTDKLEVSGGTMTGDLILNADPASSLQAATKSYVDTIAAAGLHYHDPVRVESPVALTVTYSNGTNGVGATLTNAGTQEAITIDGVALSLNDRVLIYEQADATQNGVYTVTTVGDGSTNWVLTRATDADSYGASDPDAFGEGDGFFVLEGDTGAGELYVMNASGAITFGTTNITFAQVASTAVYTAGTGLTLAGTVFNANQDISTSASPTFAGLTSTGTLTASSNLDVTGNITVTGTVDGADIATNIPSTLGTAGQVLTVNVGATAAEWADASAGSGDIVSLARSGSTLTADLSQGTAFSVGAVYNNTTFALSNIPSSGAYRGYMEIPYFGGSLTWSSDFDWEGGTAPTFTQNKDYLVEMTRSEASSSIKANYIGPFTLSSSVTFPTFVGYVSGTARGNQTQTLYLTSLTGGTASSVSENDIVVVCAHVSNNSVSNQPTVSTSGYTTAASGRQGDSYDSGLLVSYKFMGATTDPFVSVAGGGTSSDSLTIIAFVFSGVDTATPLDVTPTVVGKSNSFLANPPAITSGTGGNGAVILGIGGGGHNLGSFINYIDSASEYETFASISHNQTNDSVIGVGYAKALSDGSTFDPSAFTCSASSSGLFSCVSASVILRGA